MLEAIGENSLDVHSNASAIFNKTASVRNESQFEESKQSINDTKLFRTANNSYENEII